MRIQYVHSAGRHTLGWFKRTRSGRADSRAINTGEAQTLRRWQGRPRSRLATLTRGALAVISLAASGVAVVVGPASIPSLVPLAGASAASPTAYVANFASGTVTPIATATNTPGSPITVGTNPVAVALTPDGKTAYVVNSGSGRI
jgi:DNA-binding beta-propeller fold protein YncE